MKLLSFTIGLFLACLSAFAQTSNDEAAVRASVNQLFDGMKKADSTMLIAIFTPYARLQTVVNKDGNVSIQDDAIGKFISSVGKAPVGVLDERVLDMDIKIDSELATVWTPYAFYRAGQQHHCGANAFTLVKMGGIWKIHNIIDTRRKCQ